MCNILCVKDYTSDKENQKILQNIKPKANRIRPINIITKRGGMWELKYEEWLKRIIVVVSDDYKMPENLRRVVFERVKEKIIEILRERKI